MLIKHALCSHRFPKSPSNQIVEEEIRHHIITDEEETGNVHDPDTKEDSELNVIEQARIEATGDRIASRRIDESVILETDPLIGAPDYWMPPTRPDGWSVKERRI